MYIGVGTLFCVTLPVLMRYGIGVRMCAPSMPLPAEPSTRLSRVVPHEACLTTSTSGMPYLANRPFSLATISGAESVSAMKPRTALVVSGVAVAAYSGFGTRVPKLPAAALIAAACINWRRVSVPFALVIVVLLPDGPPHIHLSKGCASGRSRGFKRTGPQLR